MHHLGLKLIDMKDGINVVEDEKHVLLQCPGYADIRQSILYNICELNGNVINMSDDEKCLYVFLIENVCYFTAKICHEILFKRRCLLYS